MEIKVEKIKKLIKENAKFFKVELETIEVMNEYEDEEEENVFFIDLCDSDSNIVRDYIFEKNIISDNDLDNEIGKIVERFTN